MHRKAFALILPLVLTTAGIVACSSQAGISSPTPAHMTTPTPSILATAADETVTAGKSLDMPTDGVPVKAGHTLILSWSATGALECHILTASQYNQYVNFRQSGKQSGSSSLQLIKGTITLDVQNDDTYYAVLINTSTVGQSVEVYQATLTEQ